MSVDRRETLLAARGVTDTRDRLISADLPLADLQEACGGAIPGDLAIPELLEIVRHGRALGLRTAREFSAFDGREFVSAFARVNPLPDGDGGGCELLVENWHRTPGSVQSGRDVAEKLDAVDRAAAEVIARLDAGQRVQLLTGEACDTERLQWDVEKAPGALWTHYVHLHGVAHQQPLHWRLLDGVKCTFEGSERVWRARLMPIGPANEDPRGFELLLISDEPLDEGGNAEEPVQPHSRLIGTALTPVLRQPIARIIANAETIRAKLAGPLRSEYAEYAGNVAAAGQHLSTMLDDLADLEVVEAPGFSTIRETVDLNDAAQRAAGILGVRAQGRAIKLIVAPCEQKIAARAEFRRVLQVLINLIGNAIAYSPSRSTVTIRPHAVDDVTVAISVEDQGPGVSAAQAERIFDKFERLGRDSDGGADTGSGLGLYISHRLAAAMGGRLELESPADHTQGRGARFTLVLPGADAPTL